MKQSNIVQVLVVIAVIFTGCKADKSSHNKSNKLTDFNRDKFENMQLDIKGKKLSGLNNILSVDSINNNFFVYYFKDVDCRNCIDQGLRLINNRKQHDFAKTYIVISAMDTNRIFHLVGSKSSSIYFDQEDIIKKQINYSYSPALFLVSPKLYINKTFYFLGLQEDSIRYSHFLKQVK